MRGHRAALERIRASGAFEVVPNEWQVALGVLRMAHRVVFRSETIGTSSRPVRPTRRARWLAYRPLRFPFLLAERAVAPTDLSGLLQPRERLIRHLLAAHHDGMAFAYDLELLRTWPGALEELRERAAAVVDGRDPRAPWLRDLAVHVGYHEALLAATERAIRGEALLPPGQADDPDLGFDAWLRWCARQPRTPSATVGAVWTRRRPADT